MQIRGVVCGIDATSRSRRACGSKRDRVIHGHLRALDVSRPERRISVTCFRKRHDPRIRNHLPALRHRESGNNAHRRLSVFLCVHRLRYEAPAEAGRLLRLLFLRIGALSPNSGRAVGPERCSRLLHEITPWQPSRPHHPGTGSPTPAPILWRGRVWRHRRFYRSRDREHGCRSPRCRGPWKPIVRRRVASNRASLCFKATRAAMSRNAGW